MPAESIETPAAVQVLRSFIDAVNGFLLDVWRKVLGKTANKSIRLHIRVFQTRGRFSVEKTLKNATQLLLSEAGIDVVVVTNDEVNDRPHLADIQLNNASDMRAIEARENVSDTKEIVVFVVNSTLPQCSGLSAPHGDPPWAIVTTSQSEWTLAHEIGHLLGLDDISGTNRLMTGEGTPGITNPPPDLSSTEIIKIQQSSLLI